MFYVVLELNSYRQLLRLNPQVLDELEDSLTVQVESRGGRRLPGDGGFFLYLFKSREAGESGEAGRILDAAFALRDALRKRGEDLMGFYLLVEYYRDSLPPEVVQRDLRNRTRRMEMDEHITIGSSTAEIFRPLCEMEETGSGFRVLERKGSAPPALGEVKDFCVREVVANRLSEELSAYLDCIKTPEIFLIYGSVFSGLRYQLGYALRKLLGPAPVLTLYPQGGERSFLSPCVSCPEYPRFQEIPEYLSRTERKVWEEKKDIFQFLREGPPGIPHPDFPHRAVYSAFSLALTAYIRQCQENLSPAVLVCEDFHAYSSQAREVFAHIFLENLPKWRLFPICSSRKGMLGYEFRTMPYAKFRIPPIGMEEFNAILSHVPGASPDSARGMELWRKTKGKIEILYHELLAGREGPTSPEGREPFAEESDASFRVLLREERAVREVLYCIDVLSGMLPLRLFQEFLEELDITPAQGRTILQRLKELGFLRDEQGLVPLLPEVHPCLGKDDSLRRALIEEKLSVFLYGLWKDRKLHREDLLLHYFAKTPRRRMTLEIFRNHIGSKLDAGEYEEAKALLYGDSLSFEERDSHLSEWAETILLSARLRLALALDDGDGAKEIFFHLESLPLKSKENPFYGDCVLQKARYYGSLRDVKSALSLSKRAVLFYQDHDDAAGAARANNEIGLVMLAQENLFEALDYFRIARAAATSSGDRPEMLRSALFEGIAHFIWGNYSRALELFLKNEGDADSWYLRRWALVSRFLTGRVLFELGEYEEARNTFESLLAYCRSLGYEPPGRVLFAWIGRSFAYLGETAAGLGVLNSLPHTPETLLFRAEAEYIAGDHGRAKESLEQALDLPVESACFSGDGFSWKDGFFFAENLSVGRTRGTEVVLHLVKSFRAFLAVNIEEMSRLTREEKNSENDPYNRLYFYWYAGLLPEKRSEAFEDRLTILGKAVKYLQGRASRIDETAHKTAFLTGNFWNRRLLNEARNHNLV